MPVYHYTPHELLAPYIQSFCYSERRFAVPYATFDILPDSMIELVWTFGDPCFLCLSHQTHALPACYAVGLLAEPLHLTADGLVQVVRARFYPWGIYPMIGNLLQPSTIPNVTGLLSVGAELHLHGLRIPPNPQDNGAYAVERAQEILLSHMLATMHGDLPAIQAAQTLVAQNGAVSISVLANELGLSERSLRRQFQTIIQTSPKEFARLARFEFVRDTLWRTPHVSLAEVALQAGYSDQAHMQREFRQFSKQPPHQFAADIQRLRTLLSANSGRNIQDP